MHPVFKQGAGNLHRLAAAAAHQVVMVALVSAQTIQGLAVVDACALMACPPDWADGLPLDAAGYDCDYYRKD